MSIIVALFLGLGVFVGVLFAFGISLMLLEVVGLLRWLPVDAAAIRQVADFEAQKTLVKRIDSREAEYCRTVADLIASEALPDAARRDVVRSLNTLLAGSRRLSEEQKHLTTVTPPGNLSALRQEETRLQGLLEKETDPAHHATLTQLLDLNRARQQDDGALAQAAERLQMRQDVITETFVSLRGSLLRARLSQQSAGLTDPLPTIPDTLTGTSRDMQDVVRQVQQQAQSLEAATRELGRLA